MMETLLRVEGLGKKFSRDLKASMKAGAKSILNSYFGARQDVVTLKSKEFWALRDVSLELRRGEVLAVLGHNGAGKSTLLKCIAGKLQSDTGSIHINGSIGHMLEMSAGFEQALSGKENVRLRGRLLNLKGRAIEKYIQEVADFADIGEFFDAPVQFYSSGMRARLGFAASSVMNSDILILDEVLAVGDLSFRIKCYERINEISRKAGVLFVSHSLGQVARMCNRGIFLEKGRVLYDGSAQEAIRIYQDKLGQGNEKSNRYVLNPDLVSIELFASGNKVSAGQSINYGEPLALKGDISKVPREAQLRVLLRDAGSGLIMDWNSARNNIEWPRNPTCVCADLGPVELNPGAYSVSVQVMSPDGREHLCMSSAIPFRVTGELLYAIPVQKRANWSFTV
ncbi:MAG: polysaccharide ABC transporter ATP-binding protein [Nitrospirales bacterium]